MHGSGQGRAVLGQAGLGYCVRSQGQGVGFVHHDRNLLETTGRSPGVQLLRESIRGSCHSWPLALPCHCNCLLSHDMQHVGQKSMFLGCGGTQSTELGLLPDLGATLSRQCPHSTVHLFQAPAFHTLQYFWIWSIMEPRMPGSSNRRCSCLSDPSLSSSLWSLRVHESAV